MSVGGPQPLTSLKDSDAILTLACPLWVSVPLQFLEVLRPPPKVPGLTLGTRVKNRIKPRLWLSFETTNNLKQASPSLSPLLAALESSNSVLLELD